MWSVQPPEGKACWLFGTMHIRDERVYQFCQSLYPLILNADVYVGEMDLTPADLHISLQTYDLRAHFTSATFIKIRKQLLKSFGLDIARFNHLHPLMILSGISQSILVNDHAISLDEHLWGYARDNDRQLQGLESAREQIDLLHAIAPQPLYKQIEQISSRPANIRKFTSRALDSYVNGDVHALYQMTKSSMHQLRKRIIYNRNMVMVKRIMSFDPSMSYFITVGAGHLSGSKGIIALLRKGGYKIQAAPFRPIDQK